MSEMYPGSSGRTHGERNEAAPASKAAKIEISTRHPWSLTQQVNGTCQPIVPSLRRAMGADVMGTKNRGVSLTCAPAPNLIDC
jgi:hypothetical protein